MSTEQQQTLEEEIRSDAEKRADRIRKRARREADKITDHAEEEAEEEREQIMQRAREKAENLRTMHAARVQQRVRSKRQHALETILEAIRDRGVDRLSDFTGSEDYRDVLERLAAAAIDAMRGEHFGLHLRSEDAERWGDELPAWLEERFAEEHGREVTVEVTSGELDAVGGLEVAGGDGHERADQTFHGRIGRMWEDMRIEVARIVRESEEGR